MDLTEILKKLVAFKTVTHDFSENRRALSWVKDTVRPLPVHVSDHKSLGYRSLVITTQNTHSPKLWLHGHMDVVPAKREQYEAVVKNGKLFGRGVYDMKFAIACYIQLLSDLAPNLNKLDLGIMLTTDEEIGGQNGVGYLLDNGYSGSICISPDAGVDWCLEEGAKGVLHLKIEAAGDSAHGARPWLGKNAALTLIKFLQELNTYFEPGNRNPEKFLNTCSVGVIHTDVERSVINEVPDYAYAEVDIRPVDKKQRNVIGEYLESLSSKYPDITISIIADDEPFKIERDDKYIKEFAKIIKNHKDININFCNSEASSDARFFAAKGMSVISTRPLGNGHHSDHEWIDINDLTMFCQVLKEFVIKTVSIK
jgi:succinyl-diaminopimelate desuccinylase